MIERIKGLKISQIQELKELTGNEMIPCQLDNTNGKINVNTLLQYIAGLITSAKSISNDSSIPVGYQRFDDILNKPIWWTGTKWVDATGADV